MIYVLGAFDRYNYGDLLFPKILNFIFESRNISSQVKLLGLVDADLTSNGGDRVEAISKYFNQFTENDSLIIAGGEVVGASISTLYFYLKKASCLFFLYKILRKLGLTDFMDFFCKLSLGVNLKYPYLFDERKLRCRVIYNAVGGSFVSEEILAPIQNSSYFSTRSPSLYNILISKISNDSIRNKIKLFPDPVSVMSDYYKMDEIKDKVLPVNIEAIGSFNRSYIAFQVNKRFYFENKSVILKQLVELYTKTKFPIVLVPIGMAFRHEDNIACENIKSSLSIPAYYINSKTIYDIMYAIANSKLFIGTSLHGNITAMSYDVPNVGIGGRKLDEYLKKWSGGLQGAGCIALNDISSFALNVLEQKSNTYKDSNSQQKRSAYLNLNNITSVLNSQ